MADMKSSKSKSDLGVTIGRSMTGLTTRTDPDKARLLDSAERKMAVRMLFGVFITILINYIDRTNLSFASVQLNSEIGLTATTYGLGSGLFFLSYALFQLPSNIALDYFGGPKWIAFICLTWGAVAAGFAGIHNEATFLALRFLLGIFEAGAFPGMLFYISMFYPRDRTQVPMTSMVMGILISQCIGAALAAGLLSMNGIGGLQGWQWLFLIEGLLCILVSGYWWFVMPRDIASMSFITAEEREALQEVMERQKLAEAVHEGYWARIMAALRNPITLVAGIWGIFYFVAYYGIIYWAPMLTNYALGRPITSKTNNVVAVLLTAIPFAIAAVFQVLYSWHSQRTNEKRWHVVGLWLVGALCFYLLPVALQRNNAAAFAVFILATMAVYGAFSISNSYIMQLLGGERGMGGAIMNSIGNLGGFVGPYVIGALYDSTGSYFPAMYTMGAGLTVAALIVAAYQPHWSERRAMPNMHLAQAAVEGDALEKGNGNTLDKGKGVVDNASSGSSDSSFDAKDQA